MREGCVGVTSGSIANGSGVTAQAFKRLIRANGVNPGNAFFGPRRFAPSGGGRAEDDDDEAWCNYSVGTRDTLATCEIETQHYFGPKTPALICVRVRPASPGRAFPTSCIISLSTSSQRMDELAVRDVVVKEWEMNPAHYPHSDWMETTIAVKMLYHIACLIGKAPTTNTRVFLTLRFVGSSDMSQTHRIAAVGLFYTSPQQQQQQQQLITPVSMGTPGDVEALTASCGGSSIEVQLALSPTPSVSTVSDDRDVEVFSRRTSQPQFNLQYPVERVIRLDNELAPDKRLSSAPLEPFHAMNQGRICISCSGLCSSNDSGIGVHDDNDGGGGGGFSGVKFEAEDDMEECVLAEYHVQETQSSPRCRSATLPGRNTIFPQTGINEGASDGVVELLTSPCTTHSSSFHLNRAQTALELDRSADVVLMPQSPTLAAPMLSRPRSDEGSIAPRREPPPTPLESTLSEGIPFSERARWHHDDEPVLEAGGVPTAMNQSVPLLYRSAFVVPDRRDFVSVSGLLQRQQGAHRFQNGLNMQWGEHNTPPLSTQKDMNIWSAAVAKRRRRISNLHNVPVYEEQSDLLRAATELLGVDRECLRRRASSSSAPSSHFSSIPPNLLTSAQSSTPSQPQSPPPPPTPCTESSGEESKKRLASVEMERATSPVKKSKSIVAVEKVPPHLKEAVHNPPQTQTDSSSSGWTRVLRIPPQRDLTTDEAKRLQAIQDQSHGAMPEPPPPPSKYMFLPGTGNRSKAGRQPLADRSSDINFQKNNLKSAPREVGVPHGRQVGMGTAPLPLDGGVHSSEDSDGSLLVVEVEQPEAEQPPMCWGDSIVLAHPGRSAEFTAMGPFIGTFLVWKHHISRNGTAKRIFCLQRKGDAVLVSLKKLDGGKRVSQVELREKVEVITGLRAYYSNAIHTSSVRIAECCLVLTSCERQVAAVEMQSVSELRLATQILRPLCAGITL